MVTSKRRSRTGLGLRQGAVDYLVKPVATEQLVQKAQAALAAEMDDGFDCDRCRSSIRALRELDRRARTAAQGKPRRRVGAEWVGIAFDSAARLSCSRRGDREVMGYLRR